MNPLGSRRPTAWISIMVFAHLTPVNLPIIVQTAVQVIMGVGHVLNSQQQIPLSLFEAIKDLGRTGLPIRPPEVGVDHLPEGETNTSDSSIVEDQSLLSYSQSQSSLFSLAKTPINLENLRQELKDYDPEKASEILIGFSHGFPLYYHGARTPSESKNLKSANLQPDIVRQKIHTEIEAGRIAGPFDKRPLPNLRVSPLGLVPKKRPWFLSSHSPFILSKWRICK